MDTDSEYPIFYLDGTEDANISILTNETFGDEGGRSLKLGEAIAVALSTLSIIFNIFALLSIVHVKGRLSTNLRLITSLTLSDILVGVAYMGKVTNTTLNPFYFSESMFPLCWELITKALMTSAHLIVLLNLLGLAVDHFCAIVKPLNYPVIMSHRRVNFMIMAFWGIAFFVGFSRFIMPVTMYYHCYQYESINSYCERVECSKYDPEYTMYIIVVMSFFAMACLYLRIFLQIRSYQTMQGRHSRYVKRNARGLVTTFLIVTSFAMLWMPYCIFSVYIHLSLLRDSYNALKYIVLMRKAEFYLYDLVLLNSICDAVIYAVRMREVRKGFRRFLMRFTKEGRMKLNRKITRERQTSNTSGGPVMSLKHDSNVDPNQNHSEGHQMVSESHPMVSRGHPVVSEDIPLSDSHTAKNGRHSHELQKLNGGHN